MARVIKGAVGTQLRWLHRGASRFFCNYSRKLQSQDVTLTPGPGTDLLLNHLKNSNSTKAILETVGRHSGIMNNKHILQALRTLFTLQKNGDSELSTNEILRNKEFRKLCQKLRSQAGSIDLNETIDALKIISYVGVPSDTTIFQVLLQLIRQNVNSLNLQQIMFLDFLLLQTKSSALTEALKIALPIVFEIHLPVKMDYDSPVHLAECLYFASSHNLSENSVDKIIGALMRHPEYDGRTAKSIVWSICELPPTEAFAPLMKRALDSLVVHSDELTFNEMETTLTKLVLNYSRRFSYFYHEVFFDSCGAFVIDKNLGFKQSLYVLRKFGRVSFFHQFLLDYTVTKIHEDPSLLDDSDAVDVYSIVISASLTEYQPVHWTTVKNLISKMDNIAHSDRREIIWLSFASALCLLGIYRLDVLTKCLSESFLHNVFAKKTRFMSDFENYATIWQCIKLFNPELKCLLQPQFDLERLCKSYKYDSEFPLERALHKALGGVKYVQTDLFSKYGIKIDHAVVFRKGGYPVAMNFPEHLEFIEDIHVPQEHQVVAILGLKHFNYTLNSKIWKRSTSLNIKVLESLGYHVVPVCLEAWEDLPDFEKIPYLMRCIKEKIYDLKMSEGII